MLVIRNDTKNPATVILNGVSFSIDPNKACDVSLKNLNELEIPDNFVKIRPGVIKIKY